MWLWFLFRIIVSAFDLRRYYKRKKLEDDPNYNWDAAHYYGDE